MRKISLTIFLLLSLALTGCAKRDEKIERAEQAKTTPIETSEEDSRLGKVDQKVVSFNLEGYTDRGEKEWEIVGESAETIEGDLIEMTNIVANTYGDEARTTLEADKGLYDRSKTNVKLRENVKLTITDASQITKQYVGFGLKDESGGSKTVITCDGEVEFDYVGNKIYLKENVKVVSDEGQIDADKITVSLDPETKKMKEIVAEGNVRIKRDENITYSQKATYIEADKKVILSGRPKIEIYQKEDLIGDL